MTAPARFGGACLDDATRTRARDDMPAAGTILKVNHAGENGAVNIYRGQIAVCRWLRPAHVGRLREFLDHELRHRSIFQAAMRARGQRRCRSYHLCGIGGYVLGVATALCGAAAIAATTFAVETVVLRHLGDQLRQLEGRDAAAHAAVLAIVDDERAHRDASAAAGGRGGFWPWLLTPVVSHATEFVIWLGMRR